LPKEKEEPAIELGGPSYPVVRKWDIHASESTATFEYLDRYRGKAMVALRAYALVVNGLEDYERKQYERLATHAVTLRQTAREIFGVQASLR